MAASTRVQVIVSAKDNASNVLKGVGKSISGLSAKTEQLGADIKTIGKVTLAGVGALVAFGTKAAFSAARAGELSLALNAIGKANNISQEAIDGTVESLRGMNIANQKALQITSLFIQGQLDLADATKLATTAKDLAVVAGLDSSQATQTLTEAILTQRPMLLRQFGIVKGLDQIYEEYADTLSSASTKVVVNTSKTEKNVAKLSKLQGQLKVTNLRMGEFTDKTKESTKVSAQLRLDKLTKDIGALTGNTTAYSKSAGTAAKNLTELQKRQAFLAAILKGGAKVAGTYDAAMNSVSKRYRSLTGRIIPDFIEKIGAAFEPALIVIIDGITESIKGMATWVDDNGEKIAEWGEKMGAAVLMALQFFGRLVNFLSRNKELIAGVLIALALAAGFVVASFLAAHAMVIALAIAGARLILDIKGLIERFRELKDTFINEWIPALQQTKDSILRFIEDTIMWFSELPGRVMAFIKKLYIEDIPYAVGFMIGWLSVKIPEIIANIQKWWSELPGKVGETLVNLRNTITANFNAAWEWISTEVSTWPSRIESFLDVLPEKIDAILKELITTISNNLLGGGESAWGKVLDFRDKVVGAFNDVIDAVGRAIEALKRGFRAGVGSASGGDIVRHTGGIVPGPVGADVPIIAQAGERIIPAGLDTGGDSGGGGVTFNVSIGMFAGSETEKRNISKDLYASLLQVAQSQNKTVAELMGG